MIVRFPPLRLCRSCGFPEAPERRLYACWDDRLICRLCFLVAYVTAR